MLEGSFRSMSVWFSIRLENNSHLVLRALFDACVFVHVYGSEYLRSPQKLLSIFIPGCYSRESEEAIVNALNIKNKQTNKRIKIYKLTNKQNTQLIQHLTTNRQFILLQVRVQDVERQWNWNIVESGVKYHNLHPWLLGLLRYHNRYILKVCFIFALTVF